MQERVPVANLNIGMFVIELDRPWLDTPFLLQGFLIEDERTLEQLRAICEHVIVDRVRSAGQEYRAEPKQTREPANRIARVMHRIVPATTVPQPAARSATSRSTTPGTAVEEPEGEQTAPRAQGATSGSPRINIRQRGDEHAASASEELPDEFIEAHGGEQPGLFGWLRQLIPQRRERLSADNGGGADLPQDTLPPLIRIHETMPVQQELAQANEVYDKAKQFLQKTVRDIKIGKGLEIEAVESVVGDLVDSILRNPSALQLLSRLRETDSSAYDHALQIGVLLVSFGRELGFGRSELEQLGQVGLLFDIGKLRIDEALLNKRGTLSPAEFEEVKRHVQYSLEMMGDAGNIPPPVMTAVAQHHERLNGSGYPKGLRGASIGAFGRMAGIVDCFAALTSPRPYAETVSAYDAMRMLQKWGDTFFNAGMVEQFIQAIGIFPVGTLVELSTGEAAVIVEQHRAHRLKPKVLIISDRARNPLGVPITLDLLYGTGSLDGTPPYIRRGLPAESVGTHSAEFYLSHI